MWTETTHTSKTTFTQPEKCPTDEPKDKNFFIYVLFVLVGIVQLLPATFFVTANDYWMYKFRNVTHDQTDADDRTGFQMYFSATAIVFTQISGAAFSLILAQTLKNRLSVQLRLCGCLLVAVVLLVVSAIFIHVDTDSWQDNFFGLSMFIIAGVYAMTTHVGVTFISVVSKFPQDYFGAYLQGQGLAGIVTSFLQLLSISVGISIMTSAFLYFWTAIVLITACLVCLVKAGRHNDFYRYYALKTTDESVKREMNGKECFDILKCVWKSVLVFVFYLLTVSPTHPAVTSLIVSEGEEWSDVYFVPFATFTIAAVGDFAGRYIAGKLSKTIARVDGVWFVGLSVARVAIFVPLILLCNVHPRSNLPVVFPHDYQYILIMIFFSLTNGFLLTTANLIISASVPPEKLQDAYEANYLASFVLMATFSMFGFISVSIL